MSDLVDIALVWNASGFGADLAVAGADLVGDAGLETAVQLSIFTDRRAEPTDVLPLGETDRRGWWADTDGFKMGSRLWLLDRAKRTEDVFRRAESYCREALQWLVDEGVAKAVDVVIEALGAEGMAIGIKITRPLRNDVATYKFERTWRAQEARA